MSPKALPFTFVFLLAVTFCQVNSSDEVVKNKPATPGCDKRPVCPTKHDKHCKPARYFKDLCFPNVYWECAFEKPVPAVCGDGLVVNELAIEHPNDTSVALCDRPTNHKVATSEDDKSNVPHCGCSLTCLIPPECPTEVGEDCKGAVFLPFRCDCQFYWVCDANHKPHLQACASGNYFLPRGTYSGNCVSAGSHHESTACLNKAQKHRVLSSIIQNTV